MPKIRARPSAFARTSQTTVAPRTHPSTLVAGVLTMLVLAGGGVRVSPLIRRGVALPGDGFALQQSVDYVLLSPVARWLDELSLLTVSQHVAVLVSVGICGLAWALVGAWQRRRSGKSGVANVVLRRSALVIGALVSLYVVGVLVPRPMVALRASNASDVLVDFHSHTASSHDGRWNFDAAANREWHSRAGFDAAYVTDHQTMRAWQQLADRGQLADRTQAVREASILGGRSNAASTILLPGIESVSGGAHVSLLGVGRVHRTLFAHARSVDAVALQRALPADRPLVVLTLPFDVDRVPGSVPLVDAIEIADASPRGLAFARQHRALIERLADSLHVPLVASSNNHGWGATAAAWTAIRIEHWDTLSALQLDARIRAALRARPADVRVIERRALAEGGGFLADALIIPRLLLHVWRMLTWPERFAFALWAWGIWALARRRSLRLANPHPTRANPNCVRSVAHAGGARLR
ncbi:MAG: hypothetical protein ABIZ91_15140 [Gemmatimonadaceae bacterium]